MHLLDQSISFLSQLFLNCHETKALFFLCYPSPVCLCVLASVLFLQHSIQYSLCLPVLPLPSHTFTHLSATCNKRLPLLIFTNTKLPRAICWDLFTPTIFYVHASILLCASDCAVYVYVLARVCFIFQNSNSSLSSLRYTSIKPKSNLRYLRHQGLLRIQRLSYCTPYTKLFKSPISLFILRLAWV